MPSSPFVSGSRRANVEIGRHTPEAFDPPARVEGNTSRRRFPRTWTPAIFAKRSKAPSLHLLATSSAPGSVMASSRPNRSQPPCSILQIQPPATMNDEGLADASR